MSPLIAAARPGRLRAQYQVTVFLSAVMTVRLARAPSVLAGPAVSAVRAHAAFEPSRYWLQSQSGAQSGHFPA